MPAKNFINPHLRPGILSIDVYSAVNQIAINKAGPGEEVGFTVNVQSGFYLTSWRAYYADAYGDIVDLELTPTTISTYSWTFTMPDSLVVILCESAHDGSIASFPLYGYFNNHAYVENVVDFDTLVNFAISKGGVNVTNWIGWANVRSICMNIMATYSSSVVNLYYPFSTSLPTSPVTFLAVFPSVTAPGDYYGRQSYSSQVIEVTWDSSNQTVNVLPAVSTTATLLLGNKEDYSPPYTDGRAIVTNVNGYWIESDDVHAIRYILSPENSGEVTGPDTFTDTSGFTFTFRIKTAYEFRRLTPFAVGEGSVEDDITYSLDSYDGDTRTYTFTINQFPDWAIGARILIETIFVPDDQDASGTNASDGPIGGDGTFDDTSDDVPLPAIPTGISASDSGFVTLFRPTIQQVKNLGNYLWSNLDEFWENLQKIFTNPMDYIIGLNTFPVNPPVDDDRGIYIGNWLTNITMPPVRNQFYEFDCGTVNIREYFGSFLDYASNTRARIMLPFIGDRDLNINEIMNKTLRLWYRINLLSGECLAVLTIDNNVYYQWNGNCAIPIPLTGSDWSRLYGGIGKTAGAAAGFMLGGLAGETTFYVSHLTAAGMMRNAHGLMGMTIPEPVPALPPPNHGALVPYQYGSPSSMGYNPALFDPPMITETFGLSRPAKAALQAGTSAIIGHNIMGASTRVAHSGDMSGGIGLMGNRTPYIFLEYPNVNLPENYKHLYGYPSNQYATLGNLAGYTECKTVMFESTTATDDEVSLIMETLKSGVYL